MKTATFIRSASGITLAQVFSAVLSVATALYVARRLGPEPLALIGTIIAILSILENIFDVRLRDLVPKLIYAGTHREPSVIDIVKAGLVIQGAHCLLVAAIGAAATLVFGGIFVEQEVPLLIVIAFATSAALSALNGLLITLQRFARRYGAMAGVIGLSAAMRATVIVAAVTMYPTLKAVAWATALAGMAVVTVNALFLFHLGSRFAGLRDLAMPGRAGFAAYGGELRFMVHATWSGYGKLLHRAADVLLVGYFCNDRDTGLYRFARSCTDALYIFSDAIYAVVQPQLLSWLRLDRAREFQSLARRLLVLAFLLTFLIVAAEMLFLDGLLQLIVGADFVEASSLIIWLSLPLVFVLGVQTWLWPILVVRNRIVFIGILQAIIAAIIQFGVIPQIAVSPDWFAIGFALYYPLVFGTIYWVERGRSQKWMPI